MTKLWEINNQTEMYDKSEVDWIISALPTWWDMLKSVYDTNDDWIVNQADIITNQWDLATLDSVNTAQITNWAVENTKLANMNANTVKGRLSWNGTPQDIAMANLPISTATQSALDLKANDNEVVKLSWNQTIAWVKTFSSSPIVPTPTTDMQVATKKYVDDNAWWVSINTITATRLDTAESWTVTYAHSLWKIPKCILVRANRSWYTSDWWGSEWSWLTWDVNKSAYVWYLSLTSSVWTSSTYAIYMWRLDTSIYIQAWIINNVTSTNFDVVWTYTWTWIWANNVLHFTLLW